ncbi:MAG TPA: hypothetical protein VF669_08490, partial [Tepidisphaeraceae bacterium]
MAKSTVSRRPHGPFLERLECRQLLALTSISVASPNDAVFDSQRHLIYIPTGTGKVERYDLATRTLLDPWSIGGIPTRADITADGKTLLVTDLNQVNQAPVLHKIDLDTGLATTLPCGPAGAGGGTFDVAIGSDGLAYVSTSYTQNRPPFFAIDPESGAVSSTNINIREQSTLVRSADRKWIGIPYVTDGMMTYSVEQQKYIDKGSSSVTTGYGHYPAVSRDGSLFAIQSHDFGIQVVDRQVLGVRNLDAADSASAFDPLQDVLYVAAANAITAYDSQTWQPLYKLPVTTVGLYDTIPQLTIDDSGKYLAYININNGTIQVLDIPTPGGPATTFAFSGLSNFLPADQVQNVTVTVRDAAGTISTNYRGAISFLSSDLRATLPATYTFTAEDAGVHTFPVTFRKIGAVQLKAVEPTGAVTGSQSLTTHLLSPQVILPVAQRDLMYDSKRGILYVSTRTGNLERYDPASGKLLEPFAIGNPLSGLDISPG